MATIRFDDWVISGGQTDGSGRNFVMIHPSTGNVSYSVGGQPNGPAILDSSGLIVDRLSYEGAPSGVATLDTTGKVIERLSYEGTSNGVATLDSSGQVVERLSYEGTSNGVATLDASSKVIERLSYEGVPNGVATLDSVGKLVQDARGRIVQTISVAGDAADNPISTTATVGSYIMPSPQVTVSMEPGYTAIVLATLSAYTTSSHPYTIWTKIVRSLDGGASWNQIGVYSGAGHSGNYRVPMTNIARYHSVTSANVTFGITVGNAAGLSNEIHVHSAAYTGLTIIVIDEG